MKQKNTRDRPRLVYWRSTSNSKIGDKLLSWMRPFTVGNKNFRCDSIEFQLLTKNKKIIDKLLLLLLFQIEMRKWKCRITTATPLDLCIDVLALYDVGWNVNLWSTIHWIPPWPSPQPIKKKKLLQDYRKILKWWPN